LERIEIMPELITIQHPEIYRCPEGKKLYCLCITCYISLNCPTRPYSDQKCYDEINNTCQIIKCPYYEYHDGLKEDPKELPIRYLPEE